MKKITIIFSMLLLILLATSSAQALITFGIKGGLNYSNFSFSPSLNYFTDQTYLKSFCGGVFLTVNLGPIGFQPEVLYSRRGFEFTRQDPVLMTTYQAQFVLDYIEIPLLVRLNIIPLGPIKAYLLGGPSYCYLQKASYKEPHLNYQEDIKYAFKSSSLAAVAGVGLDLKIPLLVKFTLDARYHYGLTDINEKVYAILFTNKIRNTGFSLMLGIGF